MIVIRELSRKHHDVVEAMVRIEERAKASAEEVKGAPYKTPVRRLDEVRAARQLDLVWRPETEDA